MTKTVNEMPVQTLMLRGRVRPLADFRDFQDFRGPSGASDCADVQNVDSGAGRSLGADAAFKFDLELARFLEAFLDDAPTVAVHTSGSTGAPKAFEADKARMRASARATVGFLGLEAGSTNLLAMPLKYIAGRMVVVRSIECGLDLIPVPPSSNPFKTLGRPVDLCAITPMQAKTVLADPETAPMLCACRKILLGGGPVDEELRAMLESASGEAYATYGMTETLSHVALMRLNGPNPDRGFRPMPGVSVHLSDKGTLVIDAPAVCAETLETRDRAKILEDGSFRILGRLDNVVNTGGVKVQIEAVETKLAGVFPAPIAVSARRSALYGEEVVLVMGCAPGAGVGAGAMNAVKALREVRRLGVRAEDFLRARAVLERYERPHWVVLTDAIPRTGTGKPDRAGIRKIAELGAAASWKALEAGVQMEAARAATS